MTVLIAGAFCMYNRYVDGLATLAPDYPQRYADAGPTDQHRRVCHLTCRVSSKD